MACYHPVGGWRSKEVSASGKRGIVFDLNAGYVDMPVTVPCGNCVGCRMEKARVWATRCMHEVESHPESVFVTLTYDDEHIPEGGNLRPRDMVLFLKRLRARREWPLRFFQVGEYGEANGRPHHHALLFGVGFADRSWLKGQGERRLDRSAELEELWPYGMSSIGSVTFESAGYVARYAVKKVAGGRREDGRVPEYATMSRRPGIGAFWWDRFGEESLRLGSVIVNGVECGIPRYYRDREEKLDPVGVRAYKRKCAQFVQGDVDSKPKRLVVREVIHQARLASLKRGEI